MTKMESSKRTKAPVIMVSSSVYGIEELLEQIFGILTSQGFTVWMSHKGTVPVDPGKSNFENCLKAVGECDLFLGILTTRYGSGKDKDTGEISITHKEILQALTINKPRWFLAQHDLVYARGLLADLGYKTAAQRKKLSLVSKNLIDDIRVIDIYDAVIQAEKKLKDRVGNWAQPFSTNKDANIFVINQFSRYSEALKFVREQPAHARMIPKGGGTK